MTTDWNWFFSSFCQSAAALIGIIAAFIISRLLGMVEKVNLVISDFENLSIEHDKLLRSIDKRYFWWYTNRKVKYSSKLKEGIKNGEFLDLTEDQILDKIYQIHPEVYKIDRASIEAFNELIEEYTPKYDDIGNGFSIKRQHFISSLDVPPDGLFDKLSEEKEQIGQLEIQANALVSYFNKNLQNIQSFNDTIKPVKIIIILLMIAFPITVIYPLHFMPMGSNEMLDLTLNPIKIISSWFTFKSAMLFPFLVGIESVFYYFLTITRDLSLALDDALEKNNDEIRTVKHYSEHFE